MGQLCLTTPIGAAPYYKGVAFFQWLTKHGQLLRALQLGGAYGEAAATEAAAAAASIAAAAKAGPLPLRKLIVVGSEMVAAVLPQLAIFTPQLTSLDLSWQWQWQRYDSCVCSLSQALANLPQLKELCLWSYPSPLTLVDVTSISKLVLHGVEARALPPSLLDLTVDGYSSLQIGSLTHLKQPSIGRLSQETVLPPDVASISIRGLDSDQPLAAVTGLQELVIDSVQQPATMLSLGKVLLAQQASLQRVSLGYVKDYGAAECWRLWGSLPLQRLRVVDAPNFTDNDLYHIGRMKSLTTLWLRSSLPLSPGAVSGALAQLTGLHELSVVMECGADSTAQVLAALPNGATYLLLERLDVGMPAAASALAAATQLKQLVLVDGCVCDDTIITLCSMVTQLEALDVRQFWDTSVTDEIGPHLTKLPHLTSLRYNNLCWVDNMFKSVSQVFG